MTSAGKKAWATRKRNESLMDEATLKEKRSAAAKKAWATHAQKTKYVPKFETAPKLLARAENAVTYLRLSGNTSLQGQYWSLCSWQFRRPTSEINQMCRLLGMQKSQYHGVDWSESKVRRNRLLHPEANFHHGDWCEVILDYPDFNPGLVYLDTQSLAGTVALKMLARTLTLCKPGTVVMANVMQIVRYGETLESDEFMQEVGKRVPGFAKWVPERLVRSYDYTSSRVGMRTYTLYLPKETQ